MPTKPNPLVYALAALLALAFCLALSASAAITSAAVPLPTKQETLPTGNEILSYPLRGLPPGALLPYGHDLIAQAGQTSSANPSELDAACIVVVPSQNVLTLTNTLYDVDVVSATDGWAAGAFSVTQTTLDSMIQRFDGTQWNLVSEPGFMTNTNYLRGVSVISANNVWAVGAVKSGSRMETLVEHWDGTAWSRVASPNPGSGDNVLFGVNGDAADNVWAVGFYINSAAQTLAIRWNGTAWNQVPSANPGGLINVLTDIEVVPSEGNDVIAAGYFLNGSLQARTLIESYDGTQLVVKSSPNVNSFDNILYGIDSTSSTNVTAVGTYYNGSTFQTLIIEGNGTTWTIVSSPNVGTEANDLLSIAYDAQGQGVAAGNFKLAEDPNPLIVYKDSNTGQWTQSNSITEFQQPRTYRIGNMFRFRSEESGGDSTFFVVGDHIPDPPDGPRQTLVFEYSTACEGEPTPTPGGPTSTPTRTPTPAPPSATPTPCIPGQFSDVPPEHTFYPFITCLVNNNVISGYPDCTFRPANNITRGQLSKVVSNAANFTDPVSGQTFEDIPPGSTFYDFVERLASRSIIGGYACGSPGEPCVPPTNRPYFRPNANSTRGQISKIVAVAANFQDPTTDQTFEDVPIGSTFHLWVENLASRAIMSGYACGGAGEPCVPPTNRPYFRPSKNATRGQTSKIVANTFFPSCSLRR